MYLRDFQFHQAMIRIWRIRISRGPVGWPCFPHQRTPRCSRRLRRRHLQVAPVRNKRVRILARLQWRSLSLHGLFDVRPSSRRKEWDQHTCTNQIAAFGHMEAAHDANNVCAYFVTGLLSDRKVEDIGT